MALPGWPFALQWDLPVTESGKPCNPGAGAEVRYATSAGEGLFWPDETHPPRHSTWRKDLMCAGLMGVFYGSIGSHLVQLRQPHSLSMLLHLLPTKKLCGLITFWMILDALNWNLHHTFPITNLPFVLFKTLNSTNWPNPLVCCFTLYVNFSSLSWKLISYHLTDAPFPSDITK